MTKILHINTLSVQEFLLLSYNYTCFFLLVYLTLFGIFVQWNLLVSFSKKKKKEKGIMFKSGSDRSILRKFKGLHYRVEGLSPLVKEQPYVLLVSQSEIFFEVFLICPQKVASSLGGMKNLGVLHVQGRTLDVPTGNTRLSLDGYLTGGICSILSLLFRYVVHYISIMLNNRLSLG